MKGAGFSLLFLTKNIEAKLISVLALLPSQLHGGNTNQRKSKSVLAIRSTLKPFSNWDSKITIYTASAVEPSTNQDE